MQHTDFQDLSVRQSVSLSVKRVDCDKTKETCAHILTPFILVFWLEEWLVEGNLFYVKFWAKPNLSKRKRRFSLDIRS